MKVGVGEPGAVSHVAGREYATREEALAAA